MDSSVGGILWRVLDADEDLMMKRFAAWEMRGLELDGGGDIINGENDDFSCRSEYSRVVTEGASGGDRWHNR